MKPDPEKYNPDPAYLRGLLLAAGVSQKSAAKALRITDRALKYYLSSVDSVSYRPAPYLVQYALEKLAEFDRQNCIDAGVACTSIKKRVKK